MIFAAALTGFLAMPRTACAQQVVDRVIASVDGNPITVRDLVAFAAANHATLPDPNDPNAPSTKAALKGLISERMLESEVKKYQGQVDENQVNSYITEFERQAGLTNAQLRQQLQAQGVTYKQFRQHARMQIEKMMMVNKEVRDKINITPAEIKAYYDANQAKFTVKKERFKLSQILIALPPNPSPAQVQAAESKAEMVRKLAVNGGNFAALAKKYSNDSSASQGGELGYFTRGQVLDAIQNAIDNMKVGQISEPVRTIHGFHILELQALDKPGPKPLSEVSAQIRAQLMTNQAKQAFAKWVNTDLVKQHYVETIY
jgi:parvulin-like peptidyl-prolyl isomerase